MGTFDFLSGTAAPNANAQAYAPMQQYSQFANTGTPQGMDYSQVLGGGQASPATQGLDFGKIGQWALERSQYAGQGASVGQGGMPQMGGMPQGGQGQPWALPQSAPVLSHAPTQLPNNQSPGYIGRGSHLGLLGVSR